MIKDNTNDYGSYLTEPVVDGGYLNDQGLLNVALSFFGLSRCLYVKTLDTSIVSGKTYYIYNNGAYSRVSNPVESELENYYEESQEKEVILFRQYLDMAKMYCARLMDWSFLTDTMTYEEEDILNKEEIIDRDNVEAGTYIEEEDGKLYGYKMYKNFKYQFPLPTNLIKLKYINGHYNWGYAIKGSSVYCNSKTPVVDYLSSDIQSVPIDFGYMIAYRVAIEIAQFINLEGGQKASSMFTVAFQALKENEDSNFRLENPPEDYYMRDDSPYWAGKGVIV